MFRGFAIVFFMPFAALLAAENTWADDQAPPQDPDAQVEGVEVELSDAPDVSCNMFKNRMPGQSRKECVATGGGTAGSEAAVAAALKWIAKHQLADGSWNFDHRLGADPDAAKSSNPGPLSQARIAATAMAILSFLGTGQTHLAGHYQEEIKEGLSFLTSQIRPNGSLCESGGNMYSHGLASIALCEAYGMTGDQELKKPAQASLDFIAYAQDPVGSGWRYSPRQRGDTSVFGWQLFALKSGQAAGLQVDRDTLVGASEFLDSVQAGDGAFYGYTTPSKRPTTSAVGLACRIHLGWTHDKEALQQGVEALVANGVSQHNMYYNYYATQLMYQCGGERWKRWNEKMRNFLVESQAKELPEKGSWFFNGGHAASKGGRLYSTTLAAMILEVYYRHARVITEDVPDSGKPVGFSAALEPDIPITGARRGTDFNIEVDFNTVCGK